MYLRRSLSDSLYCSLLCWLTQNDWLEDRGGLRLDTLEASASSGALSYSSQLSKVCSIE